MEWGEEEGSLNIEVMNEGNGKEIEEEKDKGDDCRRKEIIDKIGKDVKKKEKSSNEEEWNEEIDRREE